MLVCIMLGASHLDSPNTTSATTYAIIARTDSGQTFYINRSKNPDNVSARPWAISEITLMEIGA